MSEVKSNESAVKPAPEVQQTPISPSESSTTGFKVLNKFIAAALLCYLVSHFLPFLVISMFGETQSSSVAEMMSGGEMVFMLFYIVLGVGAAVTGVFPMAAKIVIGLILLISGMELYDAFSEASEASEVMQMMGIDITSANGLARALQFLGIGAYLYVFSLMMMIVCLPMKLQARNKPTFSQEELYDTQKAKEKSKLWAKQSHNKFEAAIEIMNVQIAQIKAALVEHDSNASVKGFTNGVDQVKSAAQKKDASSGADGIYSALKSSVSYVVGYAKTVWNTNNTGKALVIISVVILFNLLF